MLQNVYVFVVMEPCFIIYENMERQKNWRPLARPHHTHWKGDNCNYGSD